MYASNDQFAAASKAGFDNFMAIAKTGFAGFERVVELNVATAKAMFQDASENARAVLEVKDPKELLAFNASLAQPALEKSIAYSKHLYSIMNESQSALRKSAEEQASATQKEIAALIDKSLKNAPAGSETAVAAVKSAVAAATSAYDNATKIVKQAVDMAESNFANATAAAANNVSAATKTASKRR
ncbi:MAG: phasin family protein [Burkholderiales bacterium]